jgi:hypothetical protein
LKEEIIVLKEKLEVYEAKATEKESIQRRWKELLAKHMKKRAELFVADFIPSPYDAHRKRKL